MASGVKVDNCQPSSSFRLTSLATTLLLLQFQEHLSSIHPYYSPERRAHLFQTIHPLLFFLLDNRDNLRLRQISLRPQSLFVLRRRIPQT